MLGHEGLAHTVGNRTLVQCLVCLNGHLDLVSDAHEEEATLGAVDGDLSDELIEDLREELFTEWADASLASRLFLKSIIEILLQVDHIDLRSRLRRDVTHQQRTAIGELPRRQNRVEIVLIALLLGFIALLTLVHGRLLLSLCLLVGDARGDKHGLVVPNERIRWLRHLVFCFK